MTISEATIGLPSNLNGTLKEVDFSTSVDNVFTFESGGKKWQRVFDSGVNVFRASWLKTDTAPTDLSSLLLIALADTRIKEISLDAIINIDSTVNFNGKVLKVSKGGSITGSGTIQNVVIDAPYNEAIFAISLTITAPASTTSEFSVKWWGVVADGNDISAALLKCASAVNTSYQKTILFSGASSNYLLSTSAAIPSDIILHFENGAIINCTAPLNGGIIDTSYSQQIFTSNSIVNPNSTSNGGIFSVKWLGAIGNGSVDDHTAVQAACDLVVRNNFNFRTVWFPNGIYRVDFPIIIYNWTGTRYDQHTVYLEGESSFNASGIGRGAIIRPTNKNLFGIGLQQSKGGRITGLMIEGQFTPPYTGANYDFYSCSFENYIDPTCRSDRYSPYSGIVIDPFTNGTLPPSGGGYPGLTSWYRGTGINSGSTGVLIDQVYIRRFTVGIICSPNGATQNDELIKITNIQFDSVQLAISGCQAEEKMNIVDFLMCWGNTHTIFSQNAYGVGSVGNWRLTNFNIASNVNRLLYYDGSGFFPLYIDHVYAESIGTLGVINGKAAAEMRNIVVNFEYPDISKQTQYQIEAIGNTTFNNCTFRFYGHTYPISIRGNAKFKECEFSDVPFCSGEADGQIGLPDFENCWYGDSAHLLGNTGTYTSAHTAIINSSPYGKWSSRLPGITAGEYGYDFNTGRHSVTVNLGSHSITVSETNRIFTITLSQSNLFKVAINTIVSTTIGGITSPAGFVTAINNDTGVVTISYANKGLANGTYMFNCTHKVTVGSTFIGNVTSNSPNITNIKLVDGLTTNWVGTWIKSNAHVTDVYIPYVRVLSYDSGTGTMIVSSGSHGTMNGLFFSNEGTQFQKFDAPNFSIPNNRGLQANSKFLMSSWANMYPLPQEYQVIESGFLDPSLVSDTRRAYFVPTTEFKFTIHPEGYVSFPAGSLCRSITTGSLYQKRHTDTNSINGGSIGWVQLYPNLSGNITGNTAIILPAGSVVTLIKLSSITTQTNLLIGTTPGGSEIDIVNFSGGSNAGYALSTTIRGTGSNTVNLTNISGTLTYTIILQ